MAVFKHKGLGFTFIIAATITWNIIVAMTRAADVFTTAAWADNGCRAHFLSRTIANTAYAVF